MTTVPEPTSLTAAYACKYDAFDRLIEVKSGDDIVAQYRYNGLNRLQGIRGREFDFR